MTVPGFFGTGCYVEVEIPGHNTHTPKKAGKAVGITLGVFAAAAVAGTLGFMYYRQQAGYTSSFFTAPWASSSDGSGVFKTLGGSSDGAGAAVTSGVSGTGGYGAGAGTGSYNAVP